MSGVKMKYAILGGELKQYKTKNKTKHDKGHKK